MDDFGGNPMDIREGGFEGRAVGEMGVQELARLVAERERTRRLLVLSAVAMFLVAVLVLVFAPEGRQNISYLLGSVLIIFSLGAIGASKFSAKFRDLSIDTNKG